MILTHDPHKDGSSSSNSNSPSGQHNTCSRSPEGTPLPCSCRRLPGDFGFDPLNLGKDPEALRWYQQSELVHGRTAMTAVAGILIPAVSPWQHNQQRRCFVACAGAVP
jgi:hypothetical protein